LTVRTARQDAVYLHDNYSTAPTFFKLLVFLVFS